ncbi:MAG: PDZ domain-containing protein [Gemmataceae bacterium]|nr:PDZ domain-containing protein [Gemmataceae bacterium]
MRRLLVLPALPIFASVLLAAPVGMEPAPAHAPLPPEEAMCYAAEVVRLADQVARGYVRPVARRGLLLAAVSALYDEVRRPVPEGLATDIDRAFEGVKDPPQDIEPVALDPGTQSLIAGLRQAIGAAPSLRRGNDIRISAQAMAATLDPYCMLIDSDELRKGSGEDLNHGVGIDLVPNAGLGPIVVKTVVPGGSAQREGLRPGDQITHVNGESVEGQDSAGVLHDIDGPQERVDAKAVTITFTRAEQAARKVQLTSRQFKPELVLGTRRNNDESWDYYLDPREKIAHVRIGSLEYGVAADLERVLTGLKSDGMKALILDLRWSPGGYLNEAILLARLFLKEGTIATVRSRKKAEDPYRAQGDDRFVDFPLVVLVNGETSGGAELIAAALQDNKRGVVVGQRTFGKASVQSIEPVGVANTGLKLTSGNFIRPSGKALHRFPDSKLTDDWGVRPLARHQLPLTSDLSKQMRDWWTLHNLRPAGSRESVPIDDPENDPQRETALRVARELVK